MSISLLPGTSDRNPNPKDELKRNRLGHFSTATRTHLKVASPETHWFPLRPSVEGGTAAKYMPGLGRERAHEDARWQSGEEPWEGFAHLPGRAPLSATLKADGIHMPPVCTPLPFTPMLNRASIKMIMKKNTSRKKKNGK